MKKLIITTFIITSILSCSTKNRDFDSLFTGQTLRVDYYSIGTVDTEKEELISLNTTSQWSGPTRNLIDTINQGEYRIKLTDKKSGELIYQSGFCTLFGEWRTTDEAKEKSEKYYNSKLIPMPKEPAIIDIECRNKENLGFIPAGRFEVSKETVSQCSLSQNDITDIVINGDITTKIDLTFIAEGYTHSEKEQFLSDVKRFTDRLFICPPFNEFSSDFNIRAVMVDSDSSGVDHPDKDIYRASALNSNYNTFGSQRYLTTKDMKSVSDAIWDVPTDAVFILVNESEYGGGGIYNFYAIGSANNKRTLDVFIHEFGHSFAGLADEYFYDNGNVAYDLDQTYTLNLEPWEENITTLVNFESKWKNMLPEGSEIPTIIKEGEPVPDIGVFEGGGYKTKGVYRPANHCMMRDYAPFCKVCTKTIIRNINFYCGRN